MKHGTKNANLHDPRENLRTLNEAFAVRVERWLRESGVGKEGAAAILGLSRTQLWRLLNPDPTRKEACSATLERWLRLAAAMHVPVGDLLNEALAVNPTEQAGAHFRAVLQAVPRVQSGCES